MDKVRLFGLLILAYALIILVIHFFRIGWEYYDTVTTLINVVTVLISILFGVDALRYFGLKSNQGRVVLLLVTNMVFWLVADLIWTFSEEAVISPADMLYLGGYPIVFVAVLVGIYSVKPDFFRNLRHLAVLLAVTLVVSFVYLAFFPLSWDAEISLLENLLTSGYVIADLVLVVPVILLVYFVFSGYLSRPWILIMLSIILNIVGDVYYTVNYETYAGGDLIDLVWYSSYLAVAFAFVMMKYGSQAKFSFLKETKRKK